MVSTVSPSQQPASQHTDARIPSSLPTEACPLAPSLAGWRPWWVSLLLEVGGLIACPRCGGREVLRVELEVGRRDERRGAVLCRECVCVCAARYLSESAAICCLSWMDPDEERNASSTRSRSECREAVQGLDGGHRRRRVTMTAATTTMKGKEGRER